MLKSEMYFEGRTDRFADRLDMGHERKDGSKTVWPEQLEGWVCCSQRWEGLFGADDTSKSGFLVDSWIHESGINGNI